MSDPTRTEPAEVRALLLHGALLNAGIPHDSVTPAWNGPQVETFVVKLALGVPVAKLDRVATALAYAVNADSCTITQRDGVIYLELPKPAAARRRLAPAKLDQLPPPTPLHVAAGVGVGGRAVWLDFNDEIFAQFLIAGITGSGKTLLTRWIIYRLTMQNTPARVRFLLLDPKHNELAPFGRLPHLDHPIVSDRTEIARVLAWLEGELDARLRTGRDAPRLFVVIEEVADLLKTNRGLSRLIERVAQIGRGVGVTMICTTQQPSKEHLGPAIYNFTARALGRVNAGAYAYGAAGLARVNAHKLLGKGDFVLVAGGDVTRFQAPYLDKRSDPIYDCLPHVADGAGRRLALPPAAQVADINVDPRGGRGRVEIDEQTYLAIEHAIRTGASADELKDQFGIGWTRATRLISRCAGGAA